jgi:hypothetical protein
MAHLLAADQPRTFPVAVAALVACLLLTACGANGPQPTAAELSDRELAWCLTKPGAVGSIASDNDISIPADAQQVVDEGIYDDAARWRYHDAWNGGTYADVCAQAYVQFGGADDDVDLAVLEPEARIASPSPTGNVATVDLRARAQALIPELEDAGVRLVLAIRASDVVEMETAALAVRDIVGPETDALFGLVAEPCYTDPGAAYGMTIFNWGAVADNVMRFLDEGDPLTLELAADFAEDAADSGTEWRRLDADAC